MHDAPVKQVRSADAMQTSVETSDYFAERQREIPRLARIRAAIGARRADRLFPLVMEECDSFRKVCETSRPSLDYLTSTSRTILESVRDENRRALRPITGYTHNAGAHVHVFTLRKDLARVRRALGGIEGVDRTLVVAPGPGKTVRRSGTGTRPTGRAGRTRAAGARGRSSSSAR